MCMLPMFVPKSIQNNALIPWLLQIIMRFILLLEKCDPIKKLIQSLGRLIYTNR